MKKLDNIERILFIRTDKIGDTLMNIPAIHLLRQTYPKAWITLLCDAKVSELFAGHADLDEVMAVDSDLIGRSSSDRRQLYRKIKDARFNLALVSNADKFFHRVIFFSGIAHRVGYRRKWGFLLNHTLRDDKSFNRRHEMDSNLNLVKLVSDCEWDGTAVLAVRESDKSAAADFLYRSAPHQAVIAMNVGTTHPKKRWPAIRFAQLSDKIQSEGGPKVVLLGGQEERATGAEISRLSKLPVIDGTGAFSLRGLAALLGSEKVKALISADSGPAHIAWIQGTPTVVFFAKDLPGSNPVRWGPRDGRSEIIDKSVADISADEAYEALEKVLAK